MATFYIQRFVPRGQTDTQRLAELQEYIGQLADRLNFVLSSIDEENMSEAMEKRIAALEQYMK